MDVPADILEELKCRQCDVYLSRGPVYLQHDGAAVCGRCFSSKRPATRNKEYEAVAKMLRFPCKNKDLGCQKTVAYVAEEQEIAHDATCEFRQFVCPLLGSSRCDWLGTKSQILKHCQVQHADRVLTNPCSLVHNLAAASLQNFLVKAFNLLFLLHTKVCLTSGNVYHSLRLLGATDLAKNFKYTINIRRNNELILKEGDVAPQGCLALQEPTALALDINSLLSVLGGWDGATVMLTVTRKWLRKCTECGVDVTAMLYRDQKGWRCKGCTADRIHCKFQDECCTFQDIPNKCWKHENYFCEQRTKCLICDADLPSGILSDHYTSAHKDVTHDIESKWRLTVKNDLQRCLVNCAAGTAYCVCSLDDSKFDLRIYIPVLSEQLYEYRCEVRITQSSTDLTCTYTPDITYNKIFDWRIYIKKIDVPFCTENLDICINIYKI